MKITRTIHPDGTDSLAIEGSKSLTDEHVTIDNARYALRAGAAMIEMDRDEAIAKAREGIAAGSDNIGVVRFVEVSLTP